MVGWYHQHNGREFGLTPGVGGGQEGLAPDGIAKSQTRLSD